ncbi:MAG: PA0069 family radical SAM protein, partial [Bacteroidota bacterium]
DHIEGIDEPEHLSNPQTQIFLEHPKKILSKNDSPDLPWRYSLNPYQGCEHGCIYCYARNAHEYWGWSAGLDFESKIIVKPDAPQLLEKAFLQKNWQPAPVMLSGNTDCYQVQERKYKLTRALLKVFLKYGNPVSVLTKNSLIERDIDILKELAQENLVHTAITITTLDENLRQKMEPRTTQGQRKLKTIERLAQAGIPVGLMMAPIIPGLNDHEVMPIVKAAADRGARTAFHTVVRLNGAIGPIFKDWLYKNFPDRADKVWRQIQSLHGGDVQDNRWKRRMVGEGKFAENIKQMMRVSKQKFMAERKMPPYDLTKFRRGGNLSLFS